MSDQLRSAGIVWCVKATPDCRSELARDGVDVDAAARRGCRVDREQARSYSGGTIELRWLSKRSAEGDSGV